MTLKQVVNQLLKNPEAQKRILDAVCKEVLNVLNEEYTKARQRELKKNRKKVKRITAAVVYKWLYDRPINCGFNTRSIAFHFKVSKMQAAGLVASLVAHKLIEKYEVTVNGEKLYCLN